MKYLLALLLPCPYAKKPIELKFARKLESPSLEFVDGLLDAAGIELKVRGRRMSISNKPYQAFDTEVPPDFAAAAPFITAAALTGSELKLRNLGRARGRDDFFLQVLDRMGVKLQKSKKGLIISSPQKLRAARLDLSKAPELLPFIAVLACGAKGKTTIRGAGDARDMKSDRISAMARELRRMKAKVLERRDGLLIKGPARLKGGEVDGHNDYAIVAALAVAGLIAEGETKIKNRAEALQTSYPRFISTFQELGADVRYAM
jgi:3-phosphoshikimate 1-carboxyvinyltransferase